MHFKTLALMAILFASFARAEYIPKFDPYAKAKTFGWMLDVSEVDKFDNSQRVEAYISDSQKHYILEFSCDTGEELKVQLGIEGNLGGYSYFDVLDVHSATLLSDGTERHDLNLNEVSKHSKTWTINDGYFDSGPDATDLALILATSESMDLRLYDDSGKTLDMSFPIKINQQKLKQASSLCQS